MSTKAYGSITIVDIGDLGELSVTPESNQPTMVIYDPDTNTYNPNWSTSGKNLILSPVAYYGNKKLLDSESTTIPSGMTVEWKSKINGTESILTTGTGGKLIVNTNPFNPNSVNLITYIVTITYTEPNMGTTLTASGQITFGLIQNASKVKGISISGESAFLYKSSGEVVKSSITLTATATNVNIEGWYYKNNNGTFVKIGSSTSTTFTINESDSTYFNNDIAVIRVNTNINSVFDEHTIIKVRDGAHGSSLDAAVLSNEDQMVPCDPSGTPITGWTTDCTTKLTIYEGNTETYEGWNIVVDQTHGVTGTFNESTHVFSATGITSDSGYVTFTCSKTNHNTLVKTFSLVKVKAGAAGVSPTIYSLESSSLVSNKNTNNQFNPSIITLNAFSKTGTTKSAYSGRAKYFIDDATTGVNMSSSDASSWSYTISGNPKKIKFVLYEAGGYTEELDSVTLAITSDGQQGIPGVGGLSFVLGNYTDSIPCTSEGLIIADVNIQIPFTAFKGISRVACTASYNSLPTGVSLVSNTPGTTSSDGMLVLKFAKNATLGGASILTGTIIITLTAEGNEKQQTYTWFKNLKAVDGKNGEDSIIFQIYAPNGNIISNEENNVLLDTLLVKGSSTITSGITYHWYQYSSGSYSIDRGTSKSITVLPSWVASYGSFKCVATYSGKPYDAYFSVYDKTDPLQMTVLCTLGDKIINSVGSGILYTRVFKNGEEIDPIKTIKCGTSLPSTGTTNEYFWLLNTTTKTAVLYIRGTNSWTAVDSGSDPHIGVYEWSALDKDGKEITTLPTKWGKGKALFIDANVVNKKAIFNVEVTI